MRLVLISLLALAACACADFEKAEIFDWHRRVGIPEAERIKDAETRVFAAGVQGEQAGRIVGGAVAPVGYHHYLVGMVIDLIGIQGNSVCGSTLITANRCLTAAHCWFDGRNQAWQFTMVMGSQFLFFGGEHRMPTSQVIMHPDYFAAAIRDDVAIVVLPTWVSFTPSVSPAMLPTGDALWQDFTGQWAMASGYGRTNDGLPLTTNTLVSHVNLPVISNLQCQQTFGSAQVIHSNICTNGAGGIGICGGDSGGPLILNRNGAPMVIGVSSFVAAAGCQLGHPSAFARVTSFIDWIYRNI